MNYDLSGVLVLFVSSGASCLSVGAFSHTSLSGLEFDRASDTYLLVKWLCLILGWTSLAYFHFVARKPAKH